MKNDGKTQLISKIEKLSLESNQALLHAIDALINLNADKSASKNLADTVFQLNNMIQSVSTLSYSSHARLSRDKQEDINKAVTKARIAFRMLGNGISNLEIPYTLAISNRELQTVANNMQSISGIITSLTDKMTQAINRGQTDKVHELADQQKEYFELLKNLLYTSSGFVQKGFEDGLGNSYELIQFREAKAPAKKAVKTPAPVNSTETPTPVKEAKAVKEVKVVADAKATEEVKKAAPKKAAETKEETAEKASA
jgi:hypothetical protein